MTITRIMHIVAGAFIMISLAHFVSPKWLFFTAFVGVNLFQSGFTNWCLMAVIQKMGVPGKRPGRHPESGRSSHEPHRHHNRGVLILTAMLLLPGMASGQENTAWAALGELRADTLHVSRDKVIALALAHNEMLAASGAMREAADADAQGAWRIPAPVAMGEYFLRSDDALSSFGFKLQNRSVTQADFNPVLLNEPGETNNFITRFQGCCTHLQRRHGHQRQAGRQRRQPGGGLQAQARPGDHPAACHPGL